MAALYIKDRATAELAAEVARRTGKSKTAAVREALTEFRHRLPPEAKPKRDIVAWYEQFRREHPLGPDTGLKTDKAFFDALEEEGDEPD